MPGKTPTINHIYRNFSLDSPRWEHYKPRPGDIIIATPYKSGTTWMQMIVMNLVFQDLVPRQVFELSPWLEARWGNFEEIRDILDWQEHRRFIKTHLPLDGLPYYKQVSYIVVGRDPRDVFMSLWNHYGALGAEFFKRVHNFTPERPVPTRPEDIHEFWRMWLGEGWFDWESEGYPFWSNMRHVQTWWNFRHLPNILFIHFNDLLNNLEGEIQRVASYLDIPLKRELSNQITQMVSFRNVKENVNQLLPPHSTFLVNKGTNGRWKNVLTDKDLILLETVINRELTEDCANWLRKGDLK